MYVDRSDINGYPKKKAKYTMIEDKVRILFFWFDITVTYMVLLVKVAKTSFLWPLFNFYPLKTIRLCIRKRKFIFCVSASINVFRKLFKLSKYISRNLKYFKHCVLMYVAITTLQTMFNCFVLDVRMTPKKIPGDKRIEIVSRSIK